MKVMGTLWMLMGIVAMASPALGSTRHVNCDVPGQTITKALKTAQPGDTIRVRGTCEETVTITTDRLTLEGIDGATIAGPGGGSAGDISTGQLNIVGAQGVEIRGLTVRNSAADGINSRQGAAVTLRDLTVLDSADDGIEVTEGSTAQIADCTVRRSGEHGIDIVRNSHGVFDGTVVSKDNGLPGVIGMGIFVANAAGVSFRTGSVEASGNGLDGILLLDNAAATVSTAPGPTLTIENNGRDGLSVFNGSAMGMFGGMLSASGNGRDGLRSGESAAFSAFPPATLSLTTNTERGFSVFGARALIFPGMLIEGNLLGGVFATDGGATLLNATIQNNNGSPDVNLVFGSRVTLVVTNPATINIVCDATSLLGGNTGVMCPNP